MIRTTLGLALAAMVLLMPQPASAVTPATYAAQAVHATNAHRADRAIRPLRRNACVQRFAVRQAARMAHQDRMFHQNLYRVLRRCHLTRAGENIAYGFPTGRSVVNQGWMRSAPHRHNILERRFRLIGVAARRDTHGQWFASQVFGRH